MFMSHCVICSDAFDGVDRLMTTPCGHVYHSKCLLKWIEFKQNCPECRKSVVRGSVIELYFNACSTQIDNPTSSSTETETLKIRLHETTVEASNLLKKNEELTEKNKELTEIIKKDKECIHSLEQTNYATQHELQNSLRKIPALQRDLAGTRAERETLKQELSLLKDVKTVLTGVKEETEDLLDQTANSATNGTDLKVAKRLAYCCCITRRELKKTIDEKNKLKNENIDLSKQLGFNKIKMRHANDDVIMLKKKVEQLENASKNYSLNAEPSTSTYMPCAIDTPNTIIEIDENTTECDDKHKIKCVALNKEWIKEPLSTLSLIGNSPVAKRRNQGQTVWNTTFAPSHKECEKKPFSRLPPFDHTLVAKYRKDAQSVLNIGYNGLGGHHQLYFRDPATGVPNKAPIKRKLHNPANSK